MISNMPALLAPDLYLCTYFDRIGYTGGTDPTYDTLTELVAAHTRSIPFENLDPLLGIPVTDLGAAALVDKMVHRRRGGFCYEHNRLMRYVLRSLGFGADALAGRVVWMNTDDRLPAQTHHMLAVSAPGTNGTYLVDVGFGGQTVTAPLRLVAGPAQSTRHGQYRIRGHQEGYVLQTMIAGSWQPMYTFTLRSQPLIDLQVGSWYASTHPRSGFVTGLTAALVTDDARWNLRGRNLAVHRREGATEKIRFASAAEVVGALSDTFGIDMSGLGDVEARVAEVLDS